MKTASPLTRPVTVPINGSSTELAAIGNVKLVQAKTLAFFCSAKCPGRLIIRVYDLMKELRASPLAIIGGFHTPVERECLGILLRGPSPIIICPARSIQGMRVPVEWRAPLEQGRLLVLSPFGEADRRVTAETAEARNRFVASVADAVFIAHAAPGGKTEALSKEVIGAGKSLFTLDGPENANLLELGALPVCPATAAYFLG